MKTAIVTDSNSGISEQEGKRLGVYIVPMPVIIEGKTYYEGIDLAQETFYQYLLEHKNVFSSQPSPGDVVSLWDKLLSDGYDEIVYIPMSSGLSGSYQTACMVADAYGGKVCVVDNHRISVTQRHAVEDAIILAKSGYLAREIKDILEKNAYESLVYVGVDTLEYLKKGGRVTTAGAAAGTLLNIKPLLIIEGERLDAYAKTRGIRKCKKKLLEEMKKYADSYRRKGDDIYIGAAGSFSDKAEEQEWMGMVSDFFKGEDIKYDPLTFSIGCHVGPGAFGMGVSKKLTMVKK